MNFLRFFWQSLKTVIEHGYMKAKRVVPSSSWTVSELTELRDIANSYILLSWQLWWGRAMQPAGSGGSKARLREVMGDILRLFLICCQLIIVCFPTFDNSQLKKLRKFPSQQHQLTWINDTLRRSTWVLWNKKCMNFFKKTVGERTNKNFFVAQFRAEKPFV